MGIQPKADLVSTSYNLLDDHIDILGCLQFPKTKIYSYKMQISLPKLDSYYLFNNSQLLPEQNEMSGICCFQQTTLKLLHSYDMYT